jgi:lipoate-protein ligase A
VAWRLLVEEGLVRQDLGQGGCAGPGNGPFNMGVDEALLATAVQTGTASLRFYSWDGPWLSLGYAQTVDPRQRLQEAGVGFVRRVTGGRAVLHGADLTYSIAAPDGLLPEGVRESYGAVAGALLEALADLGADVRRSASDSRAAGPGVFDCFAQPAADEICVDGRKLSGSAQRRVGGGFLQHGSIRMRPDPAEAVAAVVPGGGGLGGTSLEECGYTFSERDLVEASVRAFEGLLGCRLEPGELTDREQNQARSRAAEPPNSKGAGSHLWDAGSARIPLKS